MVIAIVVQVLGGPCYSPSYSLESVQDAFVVVVVCLFVCLFGGCYGCEHTLAALHLHP